MKWVEVARVVGACLLFELAASCRRHTEAQPRPDASVGVAPVSSVSPAPEFDGNPRIEPVPVPPLEAALLRRCPEKPGATGDEFKLDIGEQLICREKYLESSWKQASAVVGRADPKRAKQLAVLRRQWTELVQAACFIEEQRAWVDFRTGLRSDGTAYQTTEMYCRIAVVREQTLFATALRDADAGRMATRIEALAPQGEALRRLTEYIADRCGHFLRTPPQSDAETAKQGLRPFEEWKQTADASLAVLRGTRPLANSVCTSWSALGRSLGGAADCERKTELYLYRIWHMSS